MITPTQKPVLPEDKRKLSVLIDGYWRPVKKVFLEDFSFTDGAFPIVDFKYGTKESAITTAKAEERERIKGIKIISTSYSDYSKGEVREYEIKYYGHHMRVGVRQYAELVRKEFEITPQGTSWTG